MTSDYATLDFMESQKGERMRRYRPTEADHQERLFDLIEGSGTKTPNTEVGVRVVFENAEHRMKPFHLWSRDGKFWHRRTLNTMESRGWLVRKRGTETETMIDGGRSYEGTPFYLTEDGQEMLEIRADLLSL